MTDSLDIVEISLKEADNTFFISDLHLGHTNIIKYCSRPFNSIDEMNQTMITNWNNTIRPNDTVYFLGDMCFGRNSGKARDWINLLNGNITYIKGSHDQGIRPTSVLGSKVEVFLSRSIRCNGFLFYLVHSPYEIPDDWKNGYVIHGHVHNNQPFLRKWCKQVRINVSAEALNYIPISLSEIIRRLRKEILTEM